MEKKLLSKRIQCESLESIIEDVFPQFAKHFKFDEKQAVEMKHGLREVMKRTLRAAQHAVEIGAQKGVAEGFNLIQDPDFYETEKKRAARYRQLQKPQREKFDGRFVLGKILDGGEQ